MAGGLEREVGRNPSPTWSGIAQQWKHYKTKQVSTTAGNTRPTFPFPELRLFPDRLPQTIEQARIEVEREHELECIREEATALSRQRAEEAQQVLELKQAAVEAEREKADLRRRRREEATRRRAAKEKVACLQLVRQVLPLSLDRAFEELSARSWVTPTTHQVL